METSFFKKLVNTLKIFNVNLKNDFEVTRHCFERASLDCNFDLMERMLMRGIDVTTPAPSDSRIPLANFISSVGHSVNFDKVAVSDEYTIRMLDRFFELGSDANYKNKYGTSILATAVMHGMELIVDELLKRGVDINEIEEETGDTPLFIAVKSNNLKMAEKILRYDGFLELKNGKGEFLFDIIKGVDAIKGKERLNIMYNARFLEYKINMPQVVSKSRVMKV